MVAAAPTILAVSAATAAITDGVTVNDYGRDNPGLTLPNPVARTEQVHAFCALSGCSLCNHRIAGSLTLC
jgi:hypothetical protein